jgi:cysteine-S-conjugate beta-lyase
MSTFEHSKSNLGLQTELIHEPGVEAQAFHALPHPITRGSTTFFANTAEQRAPIDALGLDYSYGIHGNPTQYTLAKQLARIEQAKHCLLIPSGLNAIAVTALGFLSAGGHWLIPENAYGPVLTLAQHWQEQFNIAFDTYNPLDENNLAQKIQTNTQLIWSESPGSITFEVPKISKLSATAHQFGIPIAIDNTWSSGLIFKPFDHGIDISVQSLTKYQGGHADVIMGAVTGNNTELFAKIENQNRILGMAVSPDDCALVLRSLKTLPLRHKEQAKVALELAEFIKSQPQVNRLLHPAHPDCPGHQNWLSDFTGAASLFAFTLKPEFTDKDAVRFVDALRVFHIGYSWGGPESLALAYNLPMNRQTHIGNGPLIRLAIGLEDPNDLKADLLQAFELLKHI